jgi:hypothetical protein
LILAEYRLDSERELSLVRLIDVVCINPEVLQLILLCLFSTETNLLIARLLPIAMLCLAIASNKVLEGYLLSICSPSM